MLPFKLILVLLISHQEHKQLQQQPSSSSSCLRFNVLKLSKAYVPPPFHEFFSEENKRHEQQQRFQGVATGNSGYKAIKPQYSKGASSVVYKCLYKGKTEWACKKFKKGQLNRKMVETEIGILLKLRHPHIIQLREVFETRTEIQLVLELVTGGELFERIVERGQYTEHDAAEAVRQILSALQYLHSHGVVHRDLKPENLLYESEHEDARLKLADFGLSKMLQRHDVTMNTLCGTVGYCAPEVLLNKEYDASVDLWSLGVVTYIMLCGFEPFWDDTGEMAVCRRIIEGEFSFPSPWWDEISESAKNLILQLLNIEPLKRPTASEALNHPWVRGETPRRNHMGSTLKRLREFNARRKFRAATHAVLATHRAMYLISPERKSANKKTSSSSQY